MRHSDRHTSANSNSCAVNGDTHSDRHTGADSNSCAVNGDDGTVEHASAYCDADSVNGDTDSDKHTRSDKHIGTNQYACADSDVCAHKHTDAVANGYGNALSHDYEYAIADADPNADQYADTGRPDTDNATE